MQLWKEKSIVAWFLFVFEYSPSIFLDFKMDFTSVSHSLSMDLSIEKVLREVPVMHWRVLPS